jgi:eukaryotic-like serine/threonine-protein kinase
VLYQAKTGGAIPTSFSPDGRWLAFHEGSSASNRDIWVLPLDLADAEHPKAGKPELFLSTPKADVEAQFSPDGHWIAYSSLESGVYEVYVRPFPLRADGGKWQVSAHGGRFPLWSRTAKEMFYAETGRIMAVPYAVSGGVFAPGPPRRWSEATLSPSGNFSPYDLAPDGKRFAAFLARDNEDSTRGNVHVTFLLNFFDELKRRVP